ncbi:elongation of very long chain fatty acids protein AAEL008004-like [Pogonomyrmex barbatus]|uniref:Elongation of very long chain fatty acids protein n=1 Tax=Pogonomyrmex barbatus TaxID=144034 RepID=A0A6I9W300_9HYME|nr:elongation of very long chain fatty acids protein AAEL008004-like [Pogonomyrmex barbatus]
MKNRPPYKLKNFILLYDFIQIVINAWFVMEFISAGVFTKYIPTCSNSNFDASDATKILNMIWGIIPLKLFDYVETCVFVLRKKQNQVSILHVYHHVSNVIFVWYFLKYTLDERAAYIAYINCAVHVIMYIHYFMTAWNPKLQRMILFIKPFITRLQMVQFVAIILIMIQSFDPKCHMSKQNKKIAFMFIINVLIFLYLFYDFYKKNYIKASKQKNN